MSEPSAYLPDASVRTAKRRGIDKRVPYFFSCVENTLGLTYEERAYIRSAEPLYLDGHLHAFIHHLQLSYQRSGSPLSYEQWIRQTYLGETPGRSFGAIK